MKINYKEKKILDPQQEQENNVDFIVRKTKLQFQSQKLATEEYIAEVKHQLHEAKTEYPLDIQKICDLAAELNNYNNISQTLDELEKEFGF